MSGNFRYWRQLTSKWRDAGFDASGAHSYQSQANQRKFPAKKNVRIVLFHLVGGTLQFAIQCSLLHTSSNQADWIDIYNTSNYNEDRTVEDRTIEYRTIEDRTKEGRTIEDRQENRRQDNKWEEKRVQDNRGQDKRGQDNRGQNKRGQDNRGHIDNWREGVKVIIGQQEWREYKSAPFISVVDPKLFFSDPDPTFQEISDPDSIST